MTHYIGSCQCGAVRFEVDCDLSQTITCNCSRCRRLGAVLAFAPRTLFTLIEGDEALSDFRFNSHRIAHRFCATCGIQSFSFADGPDGTPMVAVNVNCLDGVDARTLSPVAYDGASA